MGLRAVLEGRNKSVRLLQTRFQFACESRAFGDPVDIARPLQGALRRSFLGDEAWLTRGRDVCSAWPWLEGLGGHRQARDDRAWAWSRCGSVVTDGKLSGCGRPGNHVGQVGHIVHTMLHKLAQSDL